MMTSRTLLSYDAVTAAAETSLFCLVIIFCTCCNRLYIFMISSLDQPTRRPNVVTIDDEDFTFLGQATNKQTSKQTLA